jgi:O-antigen ligase
MSANHGNTPAAWSAVTLIIVGFAVGGVGIVLASTPLTAAGAGIVVLGALVGKIMQMMGLGQKSYAAADTGSRG